MSLFKTEMLWMHPPRHPPRPVRYGHLRRRDASPATHGAATAHEASDRRVDGCKRDATVVASLDRAA